MDNLDEVFVCKPWCDEAEPESEHDCSMNVRLYDKRHYLSDDVVVPTDPALAELGAFFTRFSPAETGLMNLFVLDSDEDGAPADLAIELWRLAESVDDPSAVLPLDLQGLKDLHQAVGRAIALLEE